jgi:hypothetical protein
VSAHDEETDVVMCGGGVGDESVQDCVGDLLGGAVVPWVGVGGGEVAEQG